MTIVRITLRFVFALVACWGVAAIATLPSPSYRTHTYSMNNYVDLRYEVRTSFGNRTESVFIDFKGGVRFNLGVIPTLDETLAVLPEGIFRDALQSESPSDGNMINWVSDREIQHAGLPLKCWKREGQPRLAGFLGPPSFSWHEGLPVGRRLIPVRPRPFLFILNLALWYALMWIAEWCFLQLRARHRLRRGLCSRCAYPHPAAAEVCPECGTSICVP